MTRTLTTVTTILTAALWLGVPSKAAACGEAGERACCAGEDKAIPLGGCQRGVTVDPTKTESVRCPGSIFGTTVWCTPPPPPPAPPPAPPPVFEGSEANTRCGAPGQRACCLGENKDLYAGGCYASTTVVDPGKHVEVQCEKISAKTKVWCKAKPPARVDTDTCFGDMTPYKGGCYAAFYWRNTNGTAPPDYVGCGAGLARDADTCAKVTAGMSAAVVFMGVGVNRVSKWAKAGANADEAAGIFKIFAPFFDRIKVVFAKLGQKPSAQKLALKIKSLFPEFRAWLGKTGGTGKFTNAAELEAKLRALAGVSVGIVGAVSGRKAQAIHVLRAVTQVVSFVDPTGVTGVVAAFSWPTYGVGEFPHPGYTP